MIYISGPISGLPIEDAYVAFQKGKMKAYDIHHMDCINPMGLPHNHDKSWNSYMKEDIRAMMLCDSIFMLKGWKESAGACIEFYLANKLGLNVYFE